MEATSAPVSMDRTEELFQSLEQSSSGEIRMHLEPFEFVLSPASTRRRVYGPADLFVRRWADGAIDMLVALVGTRPERPVPTMDLV